MSMKKVPGAVHAAAQREESRKREELVTQCTEWWKRLDSERPLSGKETVQLQKFLGNVKQVLKNANG